MLWIHITAGLAGLLFGFIALYARKGLRVHVAAGRVFVVAMAALTVSAVLLAAFVSPHPGNILMGFITLYLVATAWLTVRPAPQRRADIALAALGFGTGAYGLLISLAGFQTPSRAIEGIPAAMTLAFSVIVLLAASGDLRLLRGGRAEGPGRILRHLWRMGFALWIATLSFFIGQADELPAEVRQTGVLVLPVLAVTVTLLFWVVRQSWRVLRSSRRPLAAGGSRGAGGLSGQGLVHAENRSLVAGRGAPMPRE